MPESMWGDWLPKFVEATGAVAPTDEERAIIRRAEEIKFAHRRRLEKVCSDAGLPFKFAN